MILQCGKARPNVAPAPAFATRLFPRIVVGRRAADVHHAVDGTRAANRAAFEPKLLWPAGQRSNPVAPHIRVRGDQKRADASRHSDELTRVRPAALEQQHGEPAVLGKLVGQDTSRGTRSDDHIIDAFHRGNWAPDFTQQPLSNDRCLAQPAAAPTFRQVPVGSGCDISCPPRVLPQWCLPRRGIDGKKKARGGANRSHA